MGLRPPSRSSPSMKDAPNADRQHSRSGNQVQRLIPNRPCHDEWPSNGNLKPAGNRDGRSKDHECDRKHLSWWSPPSRLAVATHAAPTPAPRPARGGWLCALGAPQRASAVHPSDAGSDSTSVSGSYGVPSKAPRISRPSISVGPLSTTTGASGSAGAIGQPAASALASNASA